MRPPTTTQGERSLDLGTSADSERERAEAQHGREHRHQDRAQPQAARFDDGVVRSHALFPAQQVDVVDQHDGVVHHDADQHHHPHDALHVDRRRGRQHDRNDPDHGHRHGEHDDERVEVTLELARHDHVDQGQREQHGDQEVGLRLLLLLVLTAERNRESVREIHSREVGADLLDRLTQRHTLLERRVYETHADAVAALDGGRSTSAHREHEGRNRERLAGRRAHGDFVQVLNGEPVLGTQPHDDRVFVAALPVLPSPTASDRRLDGATDRLHRQAEAGDLLTVELEFCSGRPSRRESRTPVTPAIRSTRPWISRAVRSATSISYPRSWISTASLPVPEENRRLSIQRPDWASTRISAPGTADASCLRRSSARAIPSTERSPIGLSRTATRSTGAEISEYRTTWFCARTVPLMRSVSGRLPRRARTTSTAGVIPAGREPPGPAAPAADPQAVNVAAGTRAGRPFK